MKLCNNVAKCCRIKDERLWFRFLIQKQNGNVFSLCYCLPSFFLLTGLDWNGVTRYQGTTISSLREPWAKNGSSLSLSLSLSKNGHRRRPLPNMWAFLLWFFPSWSVFTGFLPSFFLGYYGFFRVLPRFCLGLLGCTGLYIVLLGYFWACIGFSLGFT